LETRGFILSGIALAACLAGAATTWLLAKQDDVARTRPFSFADAVAPLTHRSARRLLTYQLAWNGAIGLASGFFSMHMLKNLKMGFLLASLHAAALALSRIVACPVWGELIDRYGSRPVLTACSFGICTLPVFYVFVTPDHLWPFAIEAVLSGALWSGHTLATFSLPLAITTREQRPYYLALSASAAGLAMIVATFAAGTIAEALPPQFMLGEVSVFRLQVLFAMSAVARLAAATLAPRLIEERAAPVSALVRATYRATGLRLQRAFLNRHDDNP
jgi:MFS family permease